MNMRLVVVVWLIEIFVMAIISTFVPDILVWDSMTSGIAFSVLAWLPAFIFGVR